MYTIIFISAESILGICPVCGTMLLTRMYNMAFKVLIIQFYLEFNFETT